MKLKWIHYVLIALLVTAIAVPTYFRNYYKPEIILKTAVKKSELADKDHILCEVRYTTGINMFLVQDENGENANEFCDIIYLGPANKIDLYANFFAASGNIYVFYVEADKDYVFSEMLNKTIAIYKVTGWDVLYPVKHDIGYFWGPKGYVTEKDIA